MEAGDAATGAA